MARSRGDAIVTLGAAVSAAEIFKRGFTARFASAFTRVALRRGIHSGSRAWLYAGAAATGYQLFHRFVGRKTEITRIKLRKGESIQVTEVRRAK
jgi:hypothetical protein